jgi:hypothetical protein
VLTVASLAAGAVERFLLVVGGLLGVIRARGGRDQAAEPVIRALYFRLDRLAVRFAILALKLRKRRFGTLPPTRWRPASERPSSSQPLNRPRNAPPPRLPTSFGWLIRLLPETECFANQLRDRLSDPEFAALLAAVPYLQQALRPLCRILGIEFPNFDAPAEAPSPALQLFAPSEPPAPQTQAQIPAAPPARPPRPAALDPPTIPRWRLKPA